jgi:hypothetical protein
MEEKELRKLKHNIITDAIKNGLKPTLEKEMTEIAGWVEEDSIDALGAMLFLFSKYVGEASYPFCKEVKRQLIRRGFVRNYNSDPSSNAIDTRFWNKKRMAAEIYIFDQCFPIEVIEEELKLWTREGKPRKIKPKHRILNSKWVNGIKGVYKRKKGERK